MNFSSSKTDTRSNNTCIIFLALVLAFIFTCNDGDGADISFPFADRQGFSESKISFDEIVYDAEGNSVTLEKLKGNVVILCFSTTWCPNCPSVLMSLDKLSEILKNRGVDNVKILALNVGEDSLETLKEHYSGNNIRNLKLYKSISSDVMKKMNILGVPTCLFFDAEGKCVGSYVGGDIDYSSDEFVSYAEKLSAK